LDRKRIIEALVFASQDPLSIARLQSILAIEDRRGIVQDLRALQEEYEALGRAFHLVEVAGGFQFRTRPELAEWVRKLKPHRGAHLTQASLETLAIIAYKQPVTRADIEFVRGVDCGAVLRGLLEKGLLKILGRKDVPGRPLVYGTSKRFLEVFGLRDLSSLPNLQEIEEMEDLPQDRTLSLFDLEDSKSESDGEEI
jgi:segregation and condensation protein B